MTTTEVKNNPVWKLQCQECEANLSGTGFKSVPLAEEFITKHSKETGHMRFGMDVLSHTICIEVLDAGEEKLCGKRSRLPCLRGSE